MSAKVVEANANIHSLAMSVAVSASKIPDSNVLMWCGPSPSQVGDYMVSLWPPAFPSESS
jgi:hypothetical protein